ncbi:MAG: mevalonate kinase [Anaerolineae bacterium]|nr:mevalonate kinase [Anaerolineae bacterium]
MIQVSAPAKIILFGEHAVVYGQAAIAVPISSLRAEAHAEFSRDKLSIIARDLDNKIIYFDGDDPLAETARLTLKKLNLKALQAKIIVQSNIPIASGLGSGAAISTVIIRAICGLTQNNLSNQEINKLVYEIEKIYHGTPSGIDNTVIVYEEAIYFVREQPIQHIANEKPLILLIGNTGKASLTKIAVGDVRKLFEFKPEHIKPVIEKIGWIAQSARQAMQNGDIQRLGQLMFDNHALLQQLTVSSPELDALVVAAKDASALGAKLSGGGRGGNMIALVTDDTKAQVKQALLGAGAVQVYETTIAKSDL